MKKLFNIVVLLSIFQQTLQDCPEEYSLTGIRAKWNKTPTAYNVESDPLCYNNDTVVKRNCTEGTWDPALDEIEPCAKVVNYFDQPLCPPGFHKISELNNDYCYKVDSTSRWNFPCFTSGGASVITDLDDDELDSLIDSLAAANLSRFYWLPAQRQKVFNPVVWSIPGPNWGQHVVTNNNLKFQNLFWKNCLALDVRHRAIITDTCTEAYPSLCFYINNIHYPAVCPEGYHAFRYKPDNGTCYGIERVESEINLSFDEFIETKCNTPMIADSLNTFIFTKIAELNGLSDDKWCWFKSINDDNKTNGVDKSKDKNIECIINNTGTVGFINSSSTLPCMACETEVIYGETELMFEYNELENKIYLTIYFPSGLWKYDLDDKGIQCFSNAKGFVRVVGISDLPYMFVQYTDEYDHQIEKIVYTINLVTDRSAQYWCEGHTFNFTLISTDKIIVNPKGKEIHVFSMTLNYYNITNDIQNMPDLENVLSIIAETLDVYKILLMDILELTEKHMTVLLHVHATVSNKYDDETLNILEQYNDLKERAIFNLPNINCSFIHLTSSVYCLPTTSNDYLTLDWELTPIGHISAPKQFCLQSNGLPVKRQCLGSYHLGGKWGAVEGQCNGNYVPSETTTFLYTVVKGRAPENNTTRFITDGLGFVLSDVDTIIPADIYYLSMSFKQVLDMASKNETLVDIGDIQNIAWVMDRVLNLDSDYMRLAQTLNSTNVILNSVNEIIEMIATHDLKLATSDVMTYESKHYSIEQAYEVAVKPQYIVQISYPELCNVTGIAIQRLSSSDKFTDFVIKPLYANTTLEDVLAIEYLEVATWLPAKLLNSLKINENETENVTTNKNVLHIIVSVFQNDVIFQELKPQNHVVNSRVVGVSIPGYLPNLKYPLPIVFRQLTPNNLKKKCSFWDFQSSNSGESLGIWKSNGCFPIYSRDDFTICECYHLTHFSQLISIPTNIYTDKSTEDKKHNKALNTITLIGAFLSLMGVVGIWVTAMVFSNWRRKAGTKVLLQLATAIALPLIFVIISNMDDTIFVKVDDGFIVKENTKIACVVLGALLHYSILASFMWMLITAVLQFIRYVRVLGVSLPSRFMFKFALIGWGIPLIPVIVVLSIDYGSYVPNSSTFKPMCYPKGYYFILGVMLPICIILFVNVILFILVLHSISRGPYEKMKSTDMNLVGAQLRLSIFLFFLLGLTWIFGIFSFTSNVMWSYLFCLTATLQGFVLFVYFIVCDPTTRNLWIALVKPPFSSTSSSRNSITSMS